MPKTETLTIDLPVTLVAEIREAVEHGDYSSSNDVVADALSRWLLRRAEAPENVEWLQQAIREGDADEGPGEPMEEAMDRLEAKYRALYGGTARAKQCA